MAKTIRGLKAELPPISILQKWRWAELPPFEANAVNALLQEVMQLRERVNVLESRLLGTVIGVHPGGGGGPAELPEEPTARGRGGKIPRPGNPAELPAV